MLEFTPNEIRIKAVELGLIQDGDELPAHLRSRAAAALVRERSAAVPPRVVSEPLLADEIVIQPGGVILVNGEVFPWLVARQAMEIGLDPDDVSTVRLTLMAKSVQILKHEPREESEKK